jgi:hypothetical protein
MLRSLELHPAARAAVGVALADKWISPEVKTIVKFETGSQNVRPFELTSYSVKP